MSAAVTTTRHDRRALIDLGGRALLVVVAAIAVAVEAPAWVRLPLSAIAAVAVAAVLMRGSRRLLDAVLVVVGGALVALVLLGLVLNVLPTGIGPVGWALAVGLVELVALVAAARRPRAPAAARRRLPLRTIAWATAAAAVLVGAVVYSTASFDTTHVAPLAMAAQPAGDETAVTVSAGAAQGPFELDLVTSRGRTVVRSDLDVAPGETVTVRIPTPTTRSTLQLIPSGSSSPVRQLVIDPSKAATR